MNHNVAPLMLNRKSNPNAAAQRGGYSNTFFDKFLRSLYIFLLLALDFVVFVYSIHGRLSDNGQYSQAVGYILGGMFAVSLLAVLLLSFSRDAQNGLCAVMTLLMTVLFLNQFAVFNVDTFVETWLNEYAGWLTFICFIPSAWLVGLLLAAGIFFAFRRTFAIFFVSVILLASGILGVRNYENSLQPQPSFSEIKNTIATTGKNANGKLVYFMLPKLPSYQLFNAVSDAQFRELRDLWLGFYALNGFEVYPNAFVLENDTSSNMIDIFNQVDYQRTKSKNRRYSEFVNNWEFLRGSLDYINLEENALYDILKKRGYGVSAYAAPGFNTCIRGSDIYADRCVVKNMDVQFYHDNSKSVERNVFTMLGEWMLSFKMPLLNDVAKVLFEMGDKRRPRVMFDNHKKTLEGAPEVVDIAATDIVKDEGGQFYAVYVDLPGDEYIYDEYCRLRRSEEWETLKNGAFYTADVKAKRAAYAAQTKCLIAKLQEYMDKLAASGQEAQTDVILQGVSPLPELAGNPAEMSAKFVKDKMVNLAIRRGRKPQFLVNANICLASDFTKSFIQSQEYCYSVDGVKAFAKDALSLKQNLINHSVIKGGGIEDIAAYYREWYADFKQKTQGEVADVAPVEKESSVAEVAEDVAEGEQVTESNNETIADVVNEQAAANSVETPSAALQEQPETSEATEKQAVEERAEETAEEESIPELPKLPQLENSIVLVPADVVKEQPAKGGSAADDAEIVQ